MLEVGQKELLSENLLIQMGPIHVGNFLVTPRKTLQEKVTPNSLKLVTPTMIM